MPYPTQNTRVWAIQVNSIELIQAVLSNLGTLLPLPVPAAQRTQLRLPRPSSSSSSRSTRLVRWGDRRVRVFAGADGFLQSLNKEERKLGRMLGNVKPILCVRVCEDDRRKIDARYSRVWWNTVGASAYLVLPKRSLGGNSKARDGKHEDGLVSKDSDGTTCCCDEDARLPLNCWGGKGKWCFDS